MPASRVKVIEMAFHKMDKDNSGVITVDDLKGYVLINSSLTLFLFFCKHFNSILMQC